jgi:hypothetical protein
MPYLCRMNFKWLRHMMMYMAGAVIVLHSVLPHSHASDLSIEEHTIIHGETEGVLDWVQLLLHDYEQLAESFVNRYSAIEFSLPAFIALVPLVVLFADSLLLDDVAQELPRFIDEMRLAQLGQVNAWGVRPPPVA